MERDNAYVLQSFTQRSAVLKKKFPIHFEEGIEGLARGTEDTARLVFGFSEKDEKIQNW